LGGVVAEDSKKGRVGRRLFLKAAAGVAGIVAAGSVPYFWKRIAGRGEDVFLIVADAMRSDIVGKVVNGREIVPSINALAARATHFADAFAACSWTKPSVASILSGTFPPYHGVEKGALTIARMPTLQSTLKDLGFYTIAINTNPWLEAEIGPVPGRESKPSYGFSEGFDFYKTQTEWRGGARKGLLACAYAYAEHVVDSLVNVHSALRLEGIGRTFTYLHFMDTHQPWLHSEPTPFTGVFHEKGLLEREGREEIYKRDLDLVMRMIIGGAPPADEGEIERLRAISFEAAAYLDLHVGRIISWLGETGRLDRATIILTSDHGDEFFEHGSQGHGHDQYNESLRVPLVISRRDIPIGMVRARVSNVSLLPTLRTWFDVPRAAGRPGAEAQTAVDDLAAFAPGREGDHAMIYSSLAGDGKVILPDGRTVLATGGEHLAFDIEKDPGEKSPSPAPADLVTRLLQFESFLANCAGRDGVRPALTSYLWQLKTDPVLFERVRAGEDVPYAVVSPLETQLDAEREEQLRALGYLH